MKNKAKVAILVCTYDDANDLWDPLNQTYKKYWADCPYNIFLATNHKKPALKPFIPLAIGNEDSWSDNIIKCLNLIDEKYVLLTFDDVFLFKNMDTYRINKLFNLAINSDWDYLRMHPSPAPDVSISSDIGLIKTNRQYRASTALALFKKEVLLDLLDKTESAWEFERNGSIRSNKYKHFYSVSNTEFPYLNGVVKGKWVPNVLSHLKNNGITIDENQRKTMTYIEATLEKLKRLRLKFFFLVIPASLRLRIKNLLIKGSIQ